MMRHVRVRGRVESMNMPVSLVSLKYILEMVHKIQFFDFVKSMKQNGFSNKSIINLMCKFNV